MLALQWVPGYILLVTVICSMITTQVILSIWMLMSLSYSRTILHYTSFSRSYYLLPMTTRFTMLTSIGLTIYCLWQLGLLFVHNSTVWVHCYTFLIFDGTSIECQYSIQLVIDITMPDSYLSCCCLCCQISHRCSWAFNIACTHYTKVWEWK